jgi:hypothetical protein
LLKHNRFFAERLRTTVATILKDIIHLSNEAGMAVEREQAMWWSIARVGVSVEDVIRAAAHALDFACRVSFAKRNMKTFVVACSESVIFVLPYPDRAFLHVAIADRPMRNSFNIPLVNAHGEP